ncbi:MAG: GNAT family N-acetyltransferase [Rhodobacteraceae bacterium]|nr:GNAT family N-acetyltransferase [Paracoccaceae bacterium]
MAIEVRPAERRDAADLARLIDLAGEGLPSYLWASIAEPGEDAFAVGMRRGLRDEGGFSWRNAAVAEVGGAVAGALVAYRIGDAPEPLEALPPMFRPLQELENLAPGSQYVNVLATYPDFRRRGVARRLLAEAEARGAGAREMSIIVADRNAPAIALYRASGYIERARRAMVKEGWVCDSGAWVLLAKPLGVAPGLAKPAKPA